MQMKAFFVFFSPELCLSFQIQQEEGAQIFQQLQPGLTVLSYSFAKSIAETKIKQA